MISERVRKDILRIVEILSGFSLTDAFCLWGLFFATSKVDAHVSATSARIILSVFSSELYRLEVHSSSVEGRGYS